MALLDAPSFELATTTPTVNEGWGWFTHSCGLPCEDDPCFAGSLDDFEETIGSLTFTPVQWGINLDDPEWGPGVHTVFMIVNVHPLTTDHAEDASGRLVWEETIVELCGIAIRCAGEGFLHIGDILQTIEGCGDDPTAMQSAFDEFGLPRMACVSISFDGVDYEHCAPLR